MQIDTTQRKVSLDIRDPDFYGDPYPSYRELQERCPMFYWQEHGIWTFVSHQDVFSLLRDRRLGRQISHLKSRDELGLPPVAAQHQPFFDIDNLSMLASEPPMHTRLRSLVQKAFVAREVAGLEARIESLCGELIVDIREKFRQGAESVDLLREYATPIPVTIIADLLGVPRDNCDDLLKLSHAMVQMYEMQRTPAMENQAVRASQEFVAFLRDYIAFRRSRLGDDLISHLIQVEEAGEKLTEDELIANCILLLNAGHEATVNVIGNGMLALLENPDQAALWRQGNVPSELAVEELLRFDTPLHQFNRWVLEPLEINGQQFEVGQEVALLLGAANRDPEVFVEPDTLRLGRQPNPHVSFGGGIHFCLGAALARLEVSIAFDKILNQLPNLRLADTSRFKNSYHFRGLESLLVAI